MDIYLKENTGIKTPQGENCDVFSIKTVGANLFANNGFSQILFFEKRIHAEESKPANAIRICEWAIENEATIEAGIERVLNFENKETTAGDEITLKGAIKLQ
jgi:hypothetical protein